MTLAIIVGLEQEALIARRWGQVFIGGGDSVGAEAACIAAIRSGATMLLSFGIAGGLDPALKPGAVLAAREVLVESVAIPAALTPTGVQSVRMLAAAKPAATAQEKAFLFAATGAACVDLESGEVAKASRRHRIPFGALRAICDPATRSLPPAALQALNGGRVSTGSIARSLLRNPFQLPGLIALAADAARARAALQSIRLDTLQI